MGEILILGAGGHAKVVAEAVLAGGYASKISFVDDRYSCPDRLSLLLGWPVIGPLSLSLQAETLALFKTAVVAIGHIPTRLRWIARLEGFGYHLPVVKHPAAWVSPSAHIDAASVVFAHASLQAEAVVGKGAILNTGCSVDHDVQLSEGVHICPGAHLAGEVKVGARSLIGIGASVIQQVCIGSDVIVGAGAAVVRDLPDGVTAVGVPACVV